MNQDQIDVNLLFELAQDKLQHKRNLHRQARTNANHAAEVTAIVVKATIAAYKDEITEKEIQHFDVKIDKLLKCVRNTGEGNIEIGDKFYILQGAHTEQASFKRGDGRWFTFDLAVVIEKVTDAFISIIDKK